jgi:hypothetical protein
MLQNPQQPPPCFGKSWDGKAPECKGGRDEGYINPRNKTNVRDQCRWYTSCASRTAATNIGPQHQTPPLIPVNRLAQPLPVPVPVQQGPGQPVQIRAAPQPTYAPQYYHPQQPAPVPQQSGYLVHPHQAYYGPSYVPMPVPQPGLQVHGYLSVPEPVDDRIHWIKRLFHELLRAMLKSAFHQGAHWFDHRTITRPPAPPPP